MGFLKQKQLFLLILGFVPLLCSVKISTVALFRSQAEQIWSFFKEVLASPVTGNWEDWEGLSLSITARPQFWQTKIRFAPHPQRGRNLDFFFFFFLLHF